MTIHEEDVTGHRSKARWSAAKKMAAVLRLLHGERVAELSQDLGVAAHQITVWRDEFLNAGKEGLKGKRMATGLNRRLREAERKIGELTLENEICKKELDKRGITAPAKRAK